MITFSLAIFDANIKDNDIFSMSGQDLGMGKGLGPEITSVPKSWQVIVFGKRK